MHPGTFKILPFSVTFRAKTTDTDAFLPLLPPCPKSGISPSPPPFPSLRCCPSSRSRALRIYGQFVRDYISPTAATGRVDIAVIVGYLAGEGEKRVELCGRRG